MTETTSLTFEAGYERLQNIAGRLNQEDVPVSEMCDLFAEGKGLEQALTEYLDTQRARVEAIQGGQGVKAFTITGQASTSMAAPLSTATREPSAKDIPVDTADFVPSSKPFASGVADDDIPF